MLIYPIRLLIKGGRNVPSPQTRALPSSHLGIPLGQGGMEWEIGEPFSHTGAAPLPQVGLLPSLQGDCLLGVEPSAHKQVGSIQFPQGLRRGLGEKINNTLASL